MRVFLTGASGFIGGSVGARLSSKGHEVRGLARSADTARRLRSVGIEPVPGSLNDVPILTEEAQQSDAVVNAADSDHRLAAETLVEALAGTGKPLLHTSGSSIVGDDARGESSSLVFTEDDVTASSGWAPEADKAARVAIDRLVVAAAEFGVRSVVLCNSLIYGHGRGVGRDSVQIPRLVRQARNSGVVRHVGPGRNVWSNVHIDDVVDLYEHAIESATGGSFFFVENGEESFGAIAQAIAKALNLGGPREWDVDSAIAEWGFEPAVYALGSNSRVRTVRARENLGWRPRHDSVTEWILTEPVL